MYIPQNCLFLAKFINFVSMKLKIMFIVILVGLLSCHRERKTIHPVYRWDATSSPKFDSAMLALQDACHNGISKSQRETAFHNLCSIANGTNDPSIQDRLLYWEARLLYNRKNGAPMVKRLKRAIPLVDSVNRIYDKRVLQLGLARLDTDIVANYFLLNELKDWFRKDGDSLMLGTTLMTLASISSYDWSRGQSDDALSLYKQTNIAFNTPELENIRIKNLLNIAYETPNKNQSDSILQLLLSSEHTRNDTYFRELVLRNNFLRTDSIHFLEENLKMLSSAKDLSNEYGLNLTLRGWKYAQEGNARKGVDYSLRGQEMLDSLAPTYYIVKVMEDLVYEYELLGKTDSALHYLHKYNFWRDSLIREKNAEAVISSEATMKIANIEATHRMQSQRNTWLSAIVGLAVVMIGGYATFLLNMKAKRREIRALHAENELIHNRASLAAKVVVMAESERVLGSMQSTIETLADEGKLSIPEARELTTALKIHCSGAGEREAFMEVHEKLHPDFARRLKEQFPTLSEPQIRLAAYIAVGMSNKQIARLLNIEPASLNTNRYRLRTKLRLSKSDSLEDFLRSFAN